MGLFNDSFDAADAMMTKHEEKKAQKEKDDAKKEAEKAKKAAEKAKKQT